MLDPGVIPLFEYGAPELKQNYRRHVTWGLVLASVLHGTMLVALRGYTYFFPEDEPARVVRIQLYPELTQPVKLQPEKIAVAAETGGPGGGGSSSPAVRVGRVLPEPAGGAMGMPQRIDLAAELGDLGMGQPILAEPKLAGAGRGTVTGTPAVGRTDLAASWDTELGSGGLDLGGSDLETALPGQGRSRGFGGRNAAAEGIRVGSGGAGETGLGQGLGAGGDDAGLGLPGRGISGRGTGNGSGAASAKVVLKNLQDFGGDYRSFTPIYKALAEWMRKNPRDLSEVVDRFMGYQPGNLTAAETFWVGDRRFEIFLLCVEATYEVRVCLVEGDEITYLIDQGFKKQSNFLRVGSLTRLPGQNAIHRFGSELREASDQRAQQFYQIFLSWWETVKHEVE
ncbi:MAG: hypothetical protein ONB48_06125 [candidate division KSB1 bacterium]|nr:hypothetical protein [candidate division KSB1 bacterium]MDZ7273123.1 hypothetical protein [candidate division KSB1 bacterium]MDZ7285225.1 hypothetical protein [candidate division KSB1 bacterium]MDZ7298257.1 hypothetical protein [candidate division KSB1 bacterium]MDZ7308268.1 hypothetical protein [candidate division KSB1 bacterium]